MGKKNSVSIVKGVVVTAIGIALYGFGGMLGIPVFANTTLKPAMAILALFGAVYGPIVGFLVGFVGHIITDAFSGWGIWVTWAFGSGLVGAGIGSYMYITKHSLDSGVFGAKEFGILTALAFISNFVGYMISAILDFLFMNEPLNKVVTQQLIVAVVNTIVIAVIGSLLMLLIAKRNASSNNLEEENV